MRKICARLLAAALVFLLGLPAPAIAKVHKVSPSERSAALKAKHAKHAKHRRHHSKIRRARKKISDPDRDGWVVVSSGDRQVKRHHRSRRKKESAAVSKRKSRKLHGRHTKKSRAERALKKHKKTRKSSAKELKSERRHHHKKSRAERKRLSKHSRKQASASRRHHRHHRRSAAVAPVRHERTNSKITAVERKFTGGGSPRRSSSEDLNIYSVRRPGQKKGVAPEVRREVQNGPYSASAPAGSAPKAGEGRF